MKLQNSYARECYQKSNPVFTSVRRETNKIPEIVSKFIKENQIKHYDFGIPRDFINYQAYAVAVSNFVGFSSKELASFVSTILSGYGIGILWAQKINQAKYNYKNIKDCMPKFVKYLKENKIATPGAIKEAISELASQIDSIFAQLSIGKLYKSAGISKSAVDKPNVAQKSVK